MTQLRKMMLEELQRRNYAQSTVKGYLRIVQDFAQHFHQPPDKLGPDHLRQYQAHLFQDKKLNAGTVQQPPNSSSMRLMLSGSPFRASSRCSKEVSSKASTQ